MGFRTDLSSLDIEISHRREERGEPLVHRSVGPPPSMHSLHFPVPRSSTRRQAGGVSSRGDSNRAAKLTGSRRHCREPANVARRIPPLSFFSFACRPTARDGINTNVQVGTGERSSGRRGKGAPEDKRAGA